MSIFTQEEWSVRRAHPVKQPGHLASGSIYAFDCVYIFIFCNVLTGVVYLDKRHAIAVAWYSGYHSFTTSDGSQVGVLQAP